MKKHLILEEIKDMQSMCENYFLHSDIEVFALRLRRYLKRLERNVKSGHAVHHGAKNPPANAQM